MPLAFELDSAEGSERENPRICRSVCRDSKAKEAGLLLGYARVSKGDEQTNTLQTKALRAAGCRRLFEEAASGGRWDRPELHRTWQTVPRMYDSGSCWGEGGGDDIENRRRTPYTA
jgi:hypothetical protein